MGQAFTKDELRQDIEFLANRSAGAGRYECNASRDTGASSNSIVAIVYGQQLSYRQVLPTDDSDLFACERMWEKLPVHRRSMGIHAMQKARNALTP